MKRLCIAFLLVFGLLGLAQAQSFAYVDTKYILDKLPEYKAAERDIEAQSKRWQDELDGMYAQIEQKYESYRAEQVLLSETLKKQRQDEILELEKRAKELQRKRFGYDGELFKMREERVKPIQDRVFAAIEQLAKDRRLNFIFDKAGAVVMLYTDTRFDLSDAVLAKLGVTVTGTPAPSGR